MSLVSSEEWSFIEEMGRKLPHLGLAERYRTALAIDPADRISWAEAEQGRITRTGYIVFGKVPAGNVETVLQHRNECMALADRYIEDPDLRAEVRSILRWHDVIEAIPTDINLYSDPVTREEKRRLEDIAARIIFEHDPQGFRRFFALYQEGETRAAKIAKDIDQAQMAMRVAGYEQQGYDPEGLGIFWRDLSEEGIWKTEYGPRIFEDAKRLRPDRFGPALTPTVWDDADFVRVWNETYGMRMEGARARNDLLFPMLRDRFGEVAGKRLVDLGCGNGNLLNVFKDSPFAEMIGIDGGQAVLDTARRELEADDRVRLVHGDITKPLTAVERHSADIVTCFFVLEEIPMEAVGGLFANVRDLLKPEGRAFLFLNHPAYALYHDLAAGFQGRPNEKFSGHRGYFDTEPVSFNLTNMNGTRGHEKMASYYHKTAESLFNGLAANSLVPLYSLAVPSSAVTYAGLQAHAPQSGDYPRFLYMELGC